jgi:predicted DsbA family dithiol-disulfide isomerase
MRIEIWSDIACPWCYLGKRRFEKALEQFEGRDEVEIIWRSFELDPEAPRSYGVSTTELLVRKYRVTTERAEQMNQHLAETAALDGLSYRLDIARPGNTFDAHRLAHHASAKGRGTEMMERLMRAYLEEGASMSDEATLVRLAVEVGLDDVESRAVLTGNAFSDEVRQDEERGFRLGVNGVPFFVIDDRYGISGAQPVDVLVNALRSIASSRPPDDEHHAAGDRCAEDGCEVHQH